MIYYIKYKYKISLGTNDYRCGDEIRPVLTGTIGAPFKEKILNVSETH